VNDANAAMPSPVKNTAIPFRSSILRLSFECCKIQHRSEGPDAAVCSISTAGPDLAPVGSGIWFSSICFLSHMYNSCVPPRRVRRTPR
jgi:hypothetical protein